MSWNFFNPISGRDFNKLGSKSCNEINIWREDITTVQTPVPTRFGHVDTRAITKNKIDELSEIEKRLSNLDGDALADIQKSVFKLTGTAMLRDVAYSYINNRKSLLGHSIIIMPYGFFCPLVCQDGTYIDSYDDFDRVRHTQTWSVPSKQIIDNNARNFTSGFLGASVKVWQQKVH